MPQTPGPTESEQRANRVASALFALAREDKGRSNTARLRDVFEDVQAALTAGVKRGIVLETLNGHGFNMTLKGFESALYRIRKQKRGETGPLTLATQAAASTSLPPPQNVLADSPVASGADESSQANHALREVMTNPNSREEKFSRYSNSSTLSTRLGQKKEF